jgi:nucleoside-diphosphate-sugar epimerase
MQSRSILVTGAKGFIGGHLCDHLHKSGYDVWELDEKGAVHGHQDVEGDLCDAACLARAFEGNPFAVVHLAARPGVRWCEQNREECWRTNVMGTGLLIEEAARHACVEHFIFVSSSLVYADAPIPWSEGVDVRTLKQSSIYARSKKIGEDLVS